MDREPLSLSNSQFYTNPISTISSILSPIAQSSGERDSKESLNSNSTSCASPAPSTSTITSTTNTPLFELTEEVRNDVCFKLNFR